MSENCRGDFLTQTVQAASITKTRAVDHYHQYHHHKGLKSDSDTLTKSFTCYKLVTCLQIRTADVTAIIKLCK